MKISAHSERYRNVTDLCSSGAVQKSYGEYLRNSNYHFRGRTAAIQAKKTPKHVSVRCNDFFACGSFEVIDVDSLFEKAKHVGHLCLSDDTYVHDVRTEGGTVHRK